jgi:hypothetical protein
MGWFGFGGSRTRDDRARENARTNRHDRESGPSARFTHKAVRIDRVGKPSRLPEDLPRRRDSQDRWDRR